MHTLYEVRVRPTGLFGTPLAGDTLFGQLCWQFVDDPGLLESDFQAVISRYGESPFMIVSTAVPWVRIDDRQGYALPRPELSLFQGDALASAAERRAMLESYKELKARKWLFVDESMQPVLDRRYLLTRQEVTQGVVDTLDGEWRREAEKAAGKGFEVVSDYSHNTINRLTSTTGNGFAPYSQRRISYLPGMVLSVFVLADASCPIAALRQAFERLGRFGYGRGASSGLGRFEVMDILERAMPDRENANAGFTLAPSLPADDETEGGWFQPLTRFGKHGGGAQLHGRPFKNPVVFAAGGSVFRLSRAALSRPYIGRGLTGVSKVISGTVVQGYSFYLPLQVEV